MQRQLIDYLPYMKTDDVLKATEAAKNEAHLLFEDQALTLLALLFADFLADKLNNSIHDVHPTSSVRTAVPA